MTLDELKTELTRQFSVALNSYEDVLSEGILRELNTGIPADRLDFEIKVWLEDGVES